MAKLRVRLHREYRGRRFSTWKDGMQTIGPRRSNQYDSILCQTGLVKHERPEPVAGCADNILVTVQHVGLRRIGNLSDASVP